MSRNLKNWAKSAGQMHKQTLRVDDEMKLLRKQLHRLTASQLFKLFPFLSDRLESDEIRHLGERIERHLYNLTEELKNFSYSVQHKTGA